MTAVEYIREKLLGDEYWYEDMTFDQIIDKAKEMEKQQIMNAWNNGFEENRPYVDHSEDYYNETYNKK